MTARLTTLGWRSRVADPDYLATCGCLHAEELHVEGGCTAGPASRPCHCDGFVMVRRERVR